MHGAHLERYLVDAMRRLLSSNPRWAPNQPQSRVWYGRDGLYLVFPKALAEVRELLEAERLPGIPKAPETLLEILGEGRDVALVTDAGTPGVSDPGTDLVAAALDAGFVVVPVPGPSAVATALSAAGIPADRYLFLGFVPRKGTERSRLLARAAHLQPEPAAR